MKLSDLLKPKDSISGAYAPGGFFNPGQIGLNQILQRSINKSSPSFKQTTTTQSGTPVATDTYQAPEIPEPQYSSEQVITDDLGNPIASKVDWYAEFGARARAGDTQAQQWLMENVIDDQSMEAPIETLTSDISEDTFSTPTSNVAYAMEKLNEIYGTKSPEDLWAMRQQLRRDESMARAGMLPEEAYMQYQGLPGVVGERGYNYADTVALNRATADIFGTQVSSIDKFMKDTEKSNSSTGGGAYSFGSNPALDVILGSGKFTKDQKNLIIGSIQSGQDPTTVILNQARSLMANPIATDVSKTQQGLKQLQDVQSALQEYYAAGGSTSLLSGSFEKVINKLGETKDPKLVNINSRIQKALQKYRNAVSGTAYSVQEGADIASIFPGINKGKELNDALLSAGIESLQSDIDTAYEEVLGRDIYQSLVGASKQEQQKQSGETFEYNGKMYKLNPDGTADQVSFNTVGSGTKKATGWNRPQRNNNPLNIKASKFTAQFPGVVGLDPKPASDGGYFLTFASPQDGFNAAVKLITEGKSYKGKTVDQAMRVWSNNGYGGEIAPSIRNKRIDQLTQQQLLQLVNVMAKREGFYA